MAGLFFFPAMNSLTAQADLWVLRREHPAGGGEMLGSPEPQDLSH
jgi:hypothetical protein